MYNIRVEQLTVGSMTENCYLVFDLTDNVVVIIDPGEDAGYIADHITQSGATPVLILATHGHFDHILAASELQLMFSIPFRVHDADRFLLDRMHETAKHFLGRHIVEQPPIITSPIVPGEKIFFGKSEFRAIQVPGHTPGSLAYYSESGNAVFVGDVLFEGGAVGRTDFSYCDPSALKKSVQTLLQLPNETTVYSGHGSTTTIAREAVYYL